jgi:hypothetical protein
VVQGDSLQRPARCLYRLSAADRAAVPIR